ncbi:MAG: hypothetical protein QNJ00_18700 [Woeseiaceae bacterium]|nr:hypothetical protein [Woeseiaceae bacterium]
MTCQTCKTTELLDLGKPERSRIPDIPDWLLLLFSLPVAVILPARTQPHCARRSCVFTAVHDRRHWNQKYPQRKEQKVNDKLDAFRAKLNGHLAAASERLDEVKTDIEAAADATGDKLEEKGEQLKARFDADKAKIAEARENAEAWLDSKKQDSEDAIAQWKHDREVEKLEKRAEKAEDNAAASIVIAVAAIDEAQLAVLEAIGARLLAEDAKQA